MDVRLAVIDSGINPRHPHVGEIAGGVAIGPDGETSDYIDYLGHGTAVAAAIREKAPGALLYAVKVFGRSLTARSDTIIHALEWCIEHEMHIVNLSLGTDNAKRRGRFEELIARAREAGVIAVAARAYLPGCLPGVVGVDLDWECPRETYRCVFEDSRPIFMASGYPRPLPGVPVEHNLKGISFAVANMAGFVARTREISADPVAVLAQAAPHM